MIRSISRLFYPNLCVACSRELSEGESQICTYCRWDMPFTDYHLEAENYVTELFAARIPFVNACSLLFFRSGSNNFRSMIHRMKYSSRRDIAYLMGEIFGATLRQSPLYDDVELLVPIPLHWTKRILRGYNQSEELCRGMSVAMGIPCEFRVVRRNRITKQQARRNRGDRWANVSGAFSLRGSHTLNEKHILLVDDVLTSGATIESCGAAIIRQCPDVRLSIATLAVAKRNNRHRDASFLDRIDDNPQ